jgi:long-chain fatty acid transport protein
MKMKRAKVALMSFLVFICAAGLGNAGGLYLYEMGTEDLGLAGAGSAARAQDAATVTSNPAGMTRLEGNRLTLGLQAVYGDMRYELDDPAKKGPGNVVGWLPAASTFYSHSITDDLKLGFALFGNFGAALDYGNDWAGRFLVKETTMMGLTLQPSLAYRINEKWSLGAGLGINYGIFNLTRDRLLAVDEKEYDDTDTAFNAKVGVLFEAADRIRLGLMWAGRVKYDFDVEAQGTLPESGMPWILPITVKVSTPQQAMFSVVTDVTKRWSLLGNIGWQQWSDFSNLKVQVGRTEQSSSLDLQDTWHGALGAQYKVSVATRLNFGVAYDTSMYNDQSRTSLTMPAGATWRFGVGVQHQLSEKSSVGAAFQYQLIEDVIVSEPHALSGRYNDPKMYFMGLNYSFRF